MILLYTKNISSHTKKQELNITKILNDKQYKDGCYKTDGKNINYKKT